MKQTFQFGCIGALLCYEMDLRITPYPLFEQGLACEPAFDYALVVSRRHALAQLTRKVLSTYPAGTYRLDTYNQFLPPTRLTPKRHKTKGIMLQMVATSRGVAALPHWQVQESADEDDVVSVHLSARAFAKPIIGAREADLTADCLEALIELARH